MKTLDLNTCTSKSGALLKLIQRMTLLKPVMLMLLTFNFLIVTSQVPQGFNYQAIARDASGEIIENTLLPVRITIQTSLSGGTVIWEEEHLTVTSNQFGLISLIVGTGTRINGNVATFSQIDWNAQPLFLKTTIRYPGMTWTTMGTTQIWSVPYSMVAKDVEGPITRLDIKGTTTNMEEALFEVKNRNGQTVFAVYNEGVRIFVDDGEKGAKGGFAVGGFGMSKGVTDQYLFVSADSIRAYIGPDAKASKGGFAVGGYNLAKAAPEEYLRVTRDSTRIYVNDQPTKASKGGFAVGGFGLSKGPVTPFTMLTPDNYLIGHNSGIKISTGLHNSFLGFETGMNTTTGGRNLFLGYQAGYSNIIGSYNTFLGYQAGYSNDASYNTFIGYRAGRNNTTGIYNTYIGYYSGYYNTTGKSNIFIGNYSGFRNTEGENNIFFGIYSGYYNATGTDNIYIGSRAGYSTTTGVNNVFIGTRTGYSNSSGRNNIFLGDSSGYRNTSGRENLFMGTRAGYSNTIGLYNVFLGFEAGYSNIGSTAYDGNFNSAVGYKAGYGNTTGQSNAFFGDRAGMDNSTGNYNTFVGKFAGIHHVSGNYNTFIGAQAGDNCTSGIGNVFIGNSAGGNNTSGDYNTFIGVQAGQGNTGNNNVCIGYRAGSSSGSLSNRLYIDVTSTAPLIYGEFDNRKVVFNGKVGVNGRNPVTNALEVLGEASKTTAGSWLANSDYRIKTDIRDIENAVELVMRLHPVRFRYSSEWIAKNASIKDKDYYNFVAQEYRQVFPESVQGSGDYLDGDPEELLQMDSYNAQIVAIKALQEVVRQNEEQQKQIELQQKKIDELNELVLNLSGQLK
jgi:hypothetical protein